MEEDFGGADLGLGRGLKPGGMEKDDSADEEFENPRPNPTMVRMNRLVSTCQLSSGKTRCRSNSCSSEVDITSPTQRSPPGKIRTFSDMLKMFKKAPVKCLTDVPIAVYAEVPLGSTFKQQRLLYENDLEEIITQNGVSMNGSQSVMTYEKCPEKNKVGKDLQDTLLKTQEEVDMLKQDLELCQKQLEAKYQAIRILQSQACAVQNKQVSVHSKTKLLNKQLQKEINELQFAIDHQEGNYVNSQSLWAERFDRACQENAALQAALEAKSAEMKKLHAEKMGLTRERDELLVLVDLQERERFESLRTPSCHEDQAYNDFSSTELAMLGACHCRVQYPEPCTCAHTAVFLKRDLARVKLQNAALLKEKDEVIITADAYRIAFEEQLSRNRGLVKKLADLTVQWSPGNTRHKMTNNNNLDKNQQKTAKELLRWVIEQLNADVTLPVRQNKVSHSSKPTNLTPETDHMEGGTSEIEPRTGLTASGVHTEATQDSTGDLSASNKEVSLSSLADKTQSELIDLLVDMVSDKTEALAHQRLAARMLASRNQELEAKLHAFEGGDDVFLSSDKLS